MILGAAFLGIKAFEYYTGFIEDHLPGAGFQFEAEHFQHAQIFFSLYYLMTGLHALHMIIGLGVMAVMLWLSWRGTITAEYYTPDRDQRAVLALRRHRVDFPVSAPLSDRPPCVTTTEASHTSFPRASTTRSSAS